NGASAALHSSQSPWEGPVGAVRVARIDGKLVINPPYEKLEKADINLIVSGTKDAIVMVEGGAKGRDPRLIKSLFLADGEMEKHNWRLQEKYELIERDDVMLEEVDTADADLIVVAFGSVARIVKSAITQAREAGLKVGLVRPITLFPFPRKRLFELGGRTKHFLVAEMNTGQMVEDVKLSLPGDCQVEFYGRPGGSVPTPEDLYSIVSENCEKLKA
ncbi:MAG TPA: hypothetical protein EYP05_00630, partial [Piscirickettsiaceae bacterium]|nr:hypothetical protein [Piscirickettsiaceae bacterium]